MRLSEKNPALKRGTGPLPILWSVVAAVCLISGVCLATSPVRSLLQEDRLEEALPLCRQFEVLSTNDTDNLFACAWVYLRTDRVDSAEKLMDRLKKNFSLPEYQLLLAYGRMKRKQFDEAKKIISAVVNDHKGTAIALTASELNAEVYEALGQLDTAAFIYKQVVDEDSRRARAHWGLGRYYLAQGDNRRAVFHLERTAKLWPKHLGSRFNLGVLYLSQENLSEAAKWLGECYRLNRGDAGVLEQLGLLFEKKGLIADAVKQWQRAVDLKKDSPLAKEKLATYSSNVIDTLIEQRRFSQALAKIDGIKDVATQPKMLLKRGIIYRNLAKYDKAVPDLRAYLNTQPNDSTATRELGICYLNMKLLDPAVQEFNKAISEDPQNGMSQAWLGFALEAKGDLPAAREAWTKAVELLKDPAELGRATRRLATVEKRIGKKEKKKKGSDEE